jgi:hypothetical protein
MPRNPTPEKEKRKRDAKGRLVARDGSTKLERWNNPAGIRALANWFREVQPHIRHANGQYLPAKLTRQQADILKQILKVDSNGNFAHQMSVIQGPRRMGKSLLILLILLWLVCSRKNYIVQLLGSNFFHSTKTQLIPLQNIIQNSPKLRLEFSPVEKCLSKTEITHPKTKSIIQLLPGTSMASSFGMGLDCLHVSDLHSAVDLEPFNALQASLLDSSNSLVLIDTNVDNYGGPVEALEKAAQVDDSIYFHSIAFNGWEDYATNAPPWIDLERAARLRDTLLEAEVKRDLYGQRSSIVNSLFPETVIELCKDQYSYPVDDLKALIGDRAHVTGGGLDRADSEWGSVFGNDNSVFCTIAKAASPDNGEPEYFVLDAHLFRPSTGKAIKRHIKSMHDKYGFKNVSLESHNTSDIQPWLVEQEIPSELVNPHSTTQNIVFPELVRIAKTGRLHISAQCTDLLGEMATMVYARLSTGKYKFGSQHQKTQHDDFVFALAWSVYSVRNQILQLYQLPNVVCKLKSPRRSHCFIMGGNLELLCGESCEAYQQVKDFYRQYMAYQTESALTLPEFYQSYVTIKGAKVYQAA